MIGACCGALCFGWLTDRLGRKRLFMITLGVYLLGTAMTGLSFTPWWFFVFRFVTGLGIGGEYASINSAIDELIRSSHRGRVDVSVNGTYWGGASAGASSSYLTVSEIFPMETRSISIGIFYAAGTAVGGAIGPLVFAALTKSGDPAKIALAFAIGGALIIVSGIIAWFLLVPAEGRSLESVATPLTAVDGPA